MEYPEQFFRTISATTYDINLFPAAVRRKLGIIQHLKNRIKIASEGTDAGTTPARAAANRPPSICCETDISPKHILYVPCPSIRFPACLVQTTQTHGYVKELLYSIAKIISTLVL